MDAIRNAKYVGKRHPICSPQGDRIDMFAVSIDHPAGQWEAIYCKTEDQAKAIERLVEEQKPKCHDCLSIGSSHCSDPINCGGVYWPDAYYRKVVAERDALVEAIREHISDGKHVGPRSQKLRDALESITKGA